MYFKLPQAPQIIKVADDFAHLSNITSTGDLNFEFTYSASSADVIKHNVSKVTVTVVTHAVKPKRLMGNTRRGAVDSRSLVTNIRTAISDAKTLRHDQLNYVIASVDSDVVSLISCTAVPQLRAGVSAAEIPAFAHPRLVLVTAGDVKRNNDPRPVLQRATNSVAVPDIQESGDLAKHEDIHALSIRMLTKMGQDPSQALSLTPRTSSEYATHNGLSNTSRAVERTTDPASRLLNTRLFSSMVTLPPTTTDDIQDVDRVQVLQRTSDDELLVTVNMLVPKEGLVLDGSPVGHVLVTFDVIGRAGGMKVCSLTRTLNISKHVQAFNLPKVPPTVRVASSSGDLVGMIEITQADRSATAVKVFRKRLWSSSADVDKYALVGTYGLTAAQGAISVPIDVPETSPVIYRVIAIGQQSAMSYEYTNVVVSPARHTSIAATTIDVTQTDTGIGVSVHNLPTDAVALYVLKWNMTTFDRKPTILNDDVFFIDSTTRSADVVSTVDGVVSPGNVYQYSARIVYHDGNVKDFGQAVLEFLDPQNGLVNVRYTNLNVISDVTPNVTFDLTIDINSTNLDQVKHMLALQGMSEIFAGDVAAQRDELAKIIAYSVDRIDTTSGERESFRTLIDRHFDDAALRKNQAVKPLVYGRSYRYEVCPQLRAPETMFNDLVKTSKDPTTLKSYSYSPAKFLHPLALNAGTIVSSKGAAQRYVKDPMGFGAIGDVTSIEVSLNALPISLNNVRAARFDRHFNNITWNVMGDMSRIDSFVVMKEVHGMRTVLGKVHSQSQSGMCQYVHKITNDDVGELRYVIQPVMGDYVRSPETVTNSLIIEGATS